MGTGSTPVEYGIKTDIREASVTSKARPQSDNERMIMLEGKRSFRALSFSINWRSKALKYEHSSFKKKEQNEYKIYTSI